MTFEIGQTVVYPHHGAAVIENITTRKLKGEDTTYLMLRVTNGDMTIQVRRQMWIWLGFATWSMKKA